MLKVNENAWNYCRGGWLRPFATRPRMGHEGYFSGGTVEFPNDHVLAEKAGQVVQAEVDSAMNDLGDSAPASVTVLVASGSVVEELVNAAKDADMLVVGSRGAGGFTRLMMGSVSSLVTQHATCPVVVIPTADRQ
jgi:nucleotide-binding universal stress UspA family protein